LRFRCTAAVTVLLIAVEAQADQRGAKIEAFEHLVIVGVGGAMEVDLSGGSVHGGGNLFIEVEAIDNWLELEVGVSALAAEGGLELSTDVLFKKPFRLSPRVELMVGLGPEVVGYRGTQKDGAFFGVEFAVDLMFWPSRHLGLWIEPSYELVFRNGREHSVASTGGVIFGW
jgi:hypothetical protein